MSANRKQLIQEINKILTTEGFQTSNIYNQSCFDMLARRQLILLLMKVLVNIDSVNESHVEEIRKISDVFLASPILVGLKTRNHPLEEDVVYERHGIPAVSINTFKNMIINNEFPEILADRGGYFVNINGDVLKECRNKYSLSLKDLANLAHVSRETIYNYENGKVKANIETAMMLEEVLNTKITFDIDLLEPYQNNEEIKTNENNDLAKLGFGVVSTEKSPFDALAKPNTKKNKESPLITDLEKNRDIKTLKKMAVPLKDLSLITLANPFFIIKNDKFKESIEGIPVIKSWELKEADDSAKFLKLVKERVNE
ncbi:transcriptional regulator [Methanobrevibacter sp. 87.7]|uniref:transcriptional regulator n=1 Tax=Methanobrevibacter sp. 87.7 TaxID=387957 RepID=UPI000B50AF07|nr:transcriptional regulator [Methanobrevibacter sp. 87.7]OWT32920.1 transcriptional regulator [Methanobrevibacter sp. 87.7]